MVTALEKEIGSLMIAFELKNHGEKAPPGWHKSQVDRHIIWDVKMDFTRKARWVKDGHKTPDSITSSYLVALMYAELLGLLWSALILICIPSSTKLRETFYYMWTRVWH